MPNTIYILGCLKRSLRSVSLWPWALYIRNSSYLLPYNAVLSKYRDQGILLPSSLFMFHGAQLPAFQSSLSFPQTSNHPVTESTHHTIFQYKLALTQSNSPCSVLGTALPMISALNQLTSGILLITLLENDC